MASFFPEKWRTIPVFPKVGSLIDPFGGRVVDAYKMTGAVDTLRETSAGLIELLAGSDGLNIIAGETGIGLFYEKDGRLTDVGINLMDFCTSCSEEDLDRMGGDDLVDMLDDMDENGDRLMINFDLKRNTLAIVGRDVSSGKLAVLASSEGIDFSLPAVANMKYREYFLHLVFHKIEDVFHFGLLVSSDRVSFTTDTKLLTTRVLTDCNYRTFLESSSPDRYDRLARRVFLLDY